MRAFFLIGVLGLGGCAPPCGQVCRKVLRCDLDSERVAQAECELSCNQQGDLYARWQDEELLQLYEDHRRCIVRSSCEELAAGTCYEGYEELFVFDPDKVLPPVSVEDTAAATP
jgi:hypothetical protein